MIDQKYQQCMDQCYECAIVCENCGSEMIRESGMKDMIRCIELTRVCAEVCRTAITIMSQSSQFAEQFCILCAEICQECSDECGKYKYKDHCQQCSEVCYECAQSCRELTGIGV
jgi:hypothetical protein